MRPDVMVKKLLLVLMGSIFLFTLSLPKGFVLAAELVNINTAEVALLDTLPGIGEVKAQAIVDYRNQNGPFAKIEDIMNVSGIGQVTFDNMKSLITVGTEENTSVPVVTIPLNTSQITNNPGVVQNEILGYEIGSVVINEIVSDPADGEVEFVELYNTTIYNVDLSGWRIEDGSGGKNILDYNLPANGFFVLEKPKGNLNNTGDIVKLFDATGGLIDQVSYGDWDDGNKNNNAQRADDPFSLARLFDGQDSDTDSVDFFVTEKITKGVNNIILSSQKNIPVVNLNAVTSTIFINKSVYDVTSSTLQTFYSFENIKISEVVPDPEGSDTQEFVEIYNAGSEEINLNGLQIDDEDGGSRPYTIDKDLFIKPGEYLAFYNTETKLVFNNTDDYVRLLDANNQVLEEVVYESAKEGQSYIKNMMGEWVWSANPTPNVKNIVNTVAKISAEKYKPVSGVSLDEIYGLEAGKRVKTQGYVAVLPNVFSTQYFYIVNDFAGVQIYMYKKDFPEMNIGDEVMVLGEISQAYGEKRIKVSKKEDIVLSGEARQINPVKIEMGDTGEALVGSLVQVEGEITELKNSYMYLDDGTSEIKVYFKKGVKIQNKDYVVGELVVVTGIIGVNKDGFQLLPRSVEDINKVSLGENVLSEEISDSMVEQYLAVTVGGLSSVLFGLVIKARGTFLLSLAKKMLRVVGGFVRRG